MLTVIFLGMSHIPLNRNSIATFTQMQSCMLQWIALLFTS